MSKPESKNAVERFLALFTEVRPGEGYSTLILCLSIFVLLNWVDTREKEQRDGSSEEIKTIEEPLEEGNAFKIVFQHKYLLLIALLMLFLNWVNTTGEYILGRTIKAAAVAAIAAGSTGGISEGQFIGKFYAEKRISK